VDKSNAMLTVAALILGFSIYDYFDDTDEMHQHEDFFTEVRSFMQHGDRNTAQMGYQMCVNQNELSLSLDHPTRDCCEVYFGGDEAKCNEAKYQ